MKTNAIPSPVRIAVAEDDEIFREKVLIPILRKNGYEVAGFPDAGSLYANLGSYTPHIVILDVGLPDESGLAVARRLRVDPSMRILMLTGLREVPDHIRGLTNGADAYLSKPVPEDLLVATVESLVRRLDAPEQGPVGQWHTDADGWRLVSPAGRNLDLMALERLLIAELLKNAGTPVDRETLINLLRNDDDADFDPHRLEMIIHRLRRRASGAFGAELPLRAVRGIGYLFTTVQG
ncbi:response regulator transcription factor [Pseudofulvimonas gallinarii]|uniref:DNA-binding response OmpR family regulator n=1 Tax=Pseudofulvimonas gallinarii TaxID=634155 RepID=A0A4R3LGD8_9GAMM|nr:response regulator transcription factor [Pseudofulvimonas gallinarii]TCS99251.1 DNA-binding response OmpR family regulator [Pseudofulvimonas gallinarii]